MFLYEQKYIGNFQICISLPLSDSVLGIVCSNFIPNGTSFSMRLLFGRILEQNSLIKIINKQKQ